MCILDNHTIVLVGKGRAASEIKRPVKQSLMFSPRDRELSAKRHAIKKLENSLTETKRELSDLKKENRLLNRLQVRQEKELNRFQTQEGELPEILARHAEEVSGNKNYYTKISIQNHIQCIYRDTHLHVLYMYLLYCMCVCAVEPAYSGH